MEAGQFDIGAFLGGAQEAVPPATGNGENLPRIQKISMNARPNQGKITIVPFSAKEGFYKFFTRTEATDNRVREFNTYWPDFEDNAWAKILPKASYGELSIENAELWEKAASLFDYVMKEEYADREVVRTRSYGLFYGIPLSHIDLNNQLVKGTEQKPSLIICPSAACPAAWNSGIATFSTAAKGDTWIPSLFNDNLEGRAGYMMIGMNKATVGFGYDMAFTPGFNNPPMINVVPPDFSISAEGKQLFGSLVEDFLGWQYDREAKSLFNREVFEVIVEDLNEIIKAKEAGKTDAQAPAAPTQAATPAPVAQAPVAEAAPAPVYVPPATEAQAPAHVDPLAGLPQVPAPPVIPNMPPPVPGSDPMLAGQ